MSLCLQGGVSAISASVNLARTEPAKRRFPSHQWLHSSQFCKNHLTSHLKYRLTSHATGQRSTASWVRNGFMTETGGGEWDEEDEEEFEEDEEEHWEEEEEEEEERVETVQVQSRLYEDSSGYSEGDEHEAKSHAANQAEEEKKQENQQQQQQPLQWLAEGAAAALKGAVEGGVVAAAVGAVLEASQPAEEHSDLDAREKGEEYSATMQMAMGNTALVYRHELGMNYARVLPNLIVGSCLQSPMDLDHLRDVEGVGAVQCLQRDSDLEYFDLDINPIIERAAERGDIRHLWTEIRDFDPFDLRMQLPRAVAALHKAVMECGTAYVHCTAGLGRAPAVAVSPGCGQVVMIAISPHLAPSASPPSLLLSLSLRLTPLSAPLPLWAPLSLLCSFSLLHSSPHPFFSLLRLLSPRLSASPHLNAPLLPPPMLSPL
ncbi:unnamed protein product [Closterium sp. Naga37s-1]|nr:unnamed protein product [Closterium sp. Naga37s-1]